MLRQILLYMLLFRVYIETVGGFLVVLILTLPEISEYHSVYPFSNKAYENS